MRSLWTRELFRLSLSSWPDFSHTGTDEEKLSTATSGPDGNRPTYSSLKKNVGITHWNLYSNINTVLKKIQHNHQMCHCLFLFFVCWCLWCYWTPCMSLTHWSLLPFQSLLWWVPLWQSLQLERSLPPPRPLSLNWSTKVNIK